MTATANAQASKTKETFRLEYTVTVDIASTSHKIWGLLTQSAKYTQWNSTITSLEGQIVAGQKIRLKSSLDPKRTFNLSVSEAEENKRMVWKSGMAPMFKGERTYTLDELPDDKVRFTMTEVFTGVMLPLISGSLPDFTESFEQFANDLKNEAEKR